ncbi:Fur family transcriptional regulator [Naumannella cuiyingiana]|uniref:Fur family ferric uptake transcriptional regulator n=1 Tax=Naumannella cuiyingiana TaxID=1347891 RepID=A0A7Z0D6R4_9ACTN|nr:Fur family transcriptional regulator [Naumannella cuiyingiana]NYI69940.1 Fur family ferric uptake transcriptional regulator [Naumannella cuiyingiana]
MATAARSQRITRQRVAVDAVLNGFDDFRSAQQVHDELRRRGQSVGLTTVYRTLQTMADAGELDVLRNSDGEAAYRRCSTGHHHHLVCRDCGRTVEIDAPEVERWAGDVAAANGFRAIRHDLEIFGTCSDC